MKDLYDAFKSNDFLKIFKLKKSYNFFVEIAKEGYKYISKNEIFRILKNQNERYYKNWTDIDIEGIINLIDEIERIFEYQMLEEYRSYLEEIFDRSGELDKDIRDKYFEALSEMVVLEDFSFDNLWSGFFSENVISASLLKLFLKYLDKKAISLNLEKSDEQDSENIAKYSINSFSAISETQKENLILLNIQDTFPKVNVNNYLFTKIQRAKMGLPTSDDKKLIGMFKIYQNILSAKNVYLAYIKDLENNIDSASVIEELKLKYGIGVIKGEISEAEELYFVKKYFLKDRKEKWEKREIGDFIPSKLEKDLNKIKNEKLKLGYYSFQEMRDCEYGYYLKKSIGEQEVEEIEDEINVKIFGTIIHSFYENVVMKNKADFENKTFKIDRNQLAEILEKVLNSFDYKVPKEYLEFYKKVSFEEILKSAEKYFEELIKKLETENDIEIYFEERIKLSSEKELFENVSINGVTDLHIKTSNKNYLFDYKSGKLRDGQKGYKTDKVYKAMEQLDYYSLMLENNNNENIEKIIVDTWEGKLVPDERSDDKILTSKDVEDVIYKYRNEEFYDLGNIKNQKNYLYKEYINICRGEDELSDDE